MLLPAQSVSSVCTHTTTTTLPLGTVCKAIFELPFSEVQEKIDIESQHQLYLGSFACG